MDVDRVNELESQINEAEEALNGQTVDFLSQDDALKAYYDKLDHISENYQSCKTTIEIQEHLDSLAQMAGGLDLLSELMATLKVPDPTVQTRIIDAVSTVYGKLNQQKAQVEHQRKSFGAAEAAAQFGAQFKLLNQSINNALGLATTPDKCDEQLSRLLVQLEELEGQFSEHDEFLADILGKRDEIFETFESHKQQLVDARQRKCQTLFDAAERILQSITRRTQKFTETDQLNTFFASDGLINKLRELAESLREHDDHVKADDIEARVKAAKAQAVRTLKDKSEIFEDGGNAIKLGPRHKFSVNSQELDITLLPRDGLQNIHLIGTDFYEAIDEPRLNDLKDYWSQATPSETDSVYRGEYLAYSIIQAARRNEENLSWQSLAECCADHDELLKHVQAYAAPRYNEGFEKGIHDHDATKILSKLIPVMEMAGTLRFTPKVRALAIQFWAEQQQQDDPALWPGRAKNALQIERLFGNLDAQTQLQAEMAEAIGVWLNAEQLPCDESLYGNIAEYLLQELGQDTPHFATTKYARHLVEQFELQLKSNNGWHDYEDALKQLSGQPAKAWALSHSWLSAFVAAQQLEEFSHFIDEAVAIINCADNVSRQDTEADLQVTVEQLLGDHRNLKEQKLTLVLDEFLQRLSHHCRVVVTGYQAFQKARQQVIEEQRQSLRLDEFKPKPLSSFVRNQLINNVYLPIIGDNLAKQMGTVGAAKRTDLMGLLLMISPPGYGKTTLVEYVANRLGLVFMKINCPTIGHEVTSVDPANAPHGGAKQELEKLNLALEMGNNVMLYLDDIQHTNPEFLQQFISLCDGTRRIEGVWKGRTKTYDMRGKKFCIVMAGNPYTESGEAFKIPDMLANRADIYNLGDVLGDNESVFNMSYIENALTSNSVLAPLATRDMSDVYKLVDMANGANVAATDLAHQYSGAEVKEITDVLKKLFAVQTVVSKVNAQYIASSAQNDQYRVEPPFKLQGSYRNMNKMAEKVSAVMTEQELLQMIADHYVGEAQLLTLGAEENLLKLAELRGNMTDTEQARWHKIKQDFVRNKSLGGDDSDPAGQIVLKLHDMVDILSSVKTSLTEKPADDGNADNRFEQLQPLLQLLERSQQDVSGLSSQLNQLRDEAKALANAAQTAAATQAQAAASQAAAQAAATQAAAKQAKTAQGPEAAQQQSAQANPVAAVQQQVELVSPNVEKLLSSMAGTFEDIIKAMVKDLQPAQTNKYLAAAAEIKHASADDNSKDADSEA